MAFRASAGLRERKVLEVLRIMYALENTDDPTTALDRSVRQFLKDTAEKFPMGDVERQVANQVMKESVAYTHRLGNNVDPSIPFQVLSTLHEYPCLDTCTPLVHYISDCVRMAWRMVNQLNPYYLDMDFALGMLLNLSGSSDN